MYKTILKLAIGTLFATTIMTTGCSQRNSEPQYFAGDQGNAEQASDSPMNADGIDSHVNGLE